MLLQEFQAYAWVGRALGHWAGANPNDDAHYLFAPDLLHGARQCSCAVSTRVGDGLFSGNLLEAGFADVGHVT